MASRWSTTARNGRRPAGALGMQRLDFGGDELRDTRRAVENRREGAAEWSETSQKSQVPRSDPRPDRGRRGKLHRHLGHPNPPSWFTPGPPAGQESCVEAILLRSA